MSLHSHPSLRRGGHSLLELVASLAAATLLVGGLGSSLLVATSTFEGQRPVEHRRAMEVQSEILADLQQATSFSVRDADSVTFTVPDRDADSNPESVSYSWSGLPTATLTYSMNGSTPQVILENVQDFQLSYLSRVSAGTPAPPPVNPAQWGTRWGASYSNFGYEEVFPSSLSSRRTLIGTRVTLPVNGIVSSITAYITIQSGGESPVAFAIYACDQNNDPADLIINTSDETVTTSGWVTRLVSPAALTAGEYYLTLAYKDHAASHHYSSTGGETHTRNKNPFTGQGWADPFGPSLEETHRVSIYATYTPQ